MTFYGEATVEATVAPQSQVPVSGTCSGGATMGARVDEAPRPPTAGTAQNLHLGGTCGGGAAAFSIYALAACCENGA